MPESSILIATEYVICIQVIPLIYILLSLIMMEEKPIITIQLTSTSFMKWYYLISNFHLSW